MNFRRLGTGDLSDFAENIQTLLAGGELDSLDAGIRADLLGALGTLPAQLATQTAAAMVAEDVRKALVSEKNATRTRVRVVLARVRDALRANIAPDKEYELCGFNRGEARRRYVAGDPADAAVTGFSNGINQIRFAGNNRPAQVVYEIWRRDGDDDRWRLHAVTKKQSFTDAGVTPGRHYEYKVRAVAATTVSNFSNAAVV